MGINIKVYDGDSGISGRLVSEQPDRFFSTAIGHARKSPERFTLLGRVDPEAKTLFGATDRTELKAEWVMIESLAIGAAERNKWNEIFKVLTDHEAFVGLEFEAA